MKKSKETGITLIALVVTIVVLLILAGVSISMLTGENGVITQAKKAKEETEIAEEKEAVQIAYTGAMGEKYDPDSITASDIQKQLDANGTKATASGNIKVKFTKSGRIYKINGSKISGPYEKTETGEKTLVEMYEQAVEDGCTNSDGSCTNEDHLHIGDYVEYTNPTSGTYTVTANTLGIATAQRYDVSLNQLNWRVMGIDSTTGGIKIMASQPLKKSNDDGTALNSDPYLWMYSAKAYTNSITELNNICKMYTTEYGTARSMTQEDVNELTGVTTTESIKKYNMDAYNGGKNYGETYSFSSQYTPESWLNNKTTTTVSGTVDGYYYTVNSKYEDDAPYVTMSNTRAYNMLFKNTDFGGTGCVGSGNGRHYWLASLGVRANSSYARFGPGFLDSSSGVSTAGTFNMFGSVGYEHDCFAAVCPVVSLESDVKNTEVPKIDDIIEADWNYKITSEPDVEKNTEL